MTKAFSVIIPCYNRADLVTSTIDAILQQILPPVEIIVVDDGSTDNIKEVVGRYGSPVRLLQISNCGPAGARHAGVQASRGDYIAFCDSDDLWMPDHLLNLARVLDMNTVPFAFSNFIHFKNDILQGEDKFSHAPANYWEFAENFVHDDVAIVDAPLFQNILEFQPIYPSCSAMSRRFYELAGGYNQAFGFVASEDLEFTLRCVCVRDSSVGIVFKPTVGYRLHDSNRSAVKSNDYFGGVARQMHGETLILAYSRDHHPVDPVWVDAINRQIVKRALIGFDAAFVAGKIDLVRYFAEHIPSNSRNFKFQVKKAVASMPMALSAKLSHGLAGPR